MVARVVDVAATASGEALQDRPVPVEVVACPQAAGAGALGGGAAGGQGRPVGEGGAGVGGAGVGGAGVGGAGVGGAELGERGEDETEGPGGQWWRGDVGWCRRIRGHAAW
jgi:hypothetical protein